MTGVCVPGSGSVYSLEHLVVMAAVVGGGGWGMARLQSGKPENKYLPSLPVIISK